MNLLASPKALALLDYIRRHDGRVAIDDLHAAFPADERWIDVLLEADCIDTDGLATDALPGVVSIYATHYVLTPQGEAALFADYKKRKHNARKNAEKKQERAQAAKDKREGRRHDYLVAAFGAVVGSALTLLIEHIGELIAIVKQLILNTPAP